MAKILLNIGKAGVSIGLLWLLLHKIDFRQAFADARRIEGGYLVAALALAYVHVGCGTWRWSLFTRLLGIRLKVGRLFALFYASIFYGAILPGIIGSDAVRIFSSHKAGVSLRPAAHSVLLERVFTMLGLLLWVSVGQLWLPRVSQPWLFPLIALLGFLGAGCLCLGDQLPAAFYKLKVFRFVAEFARDFRLAFSRPLYAAFIFGVVILGHVIFALVAYMLALGLGQPAQLLPMLVSIPAVLLLMALPVSIGGWGVREGTFVIVLGLQGIGAAPALAISILHGLVFMCSALPGGIFAFWPLKERGQGPRRALNESGQGTSPLSPKAQSTGESPS